MCLFLLISQPVNLEQFGLAKKNKINQIQITFSSYSTQRDFFFYKKTDYILYAFTYTFNRFEWPSQTFFSTIDGNTRNHSIQIPNATCVMKFCLVNIVIFIAAKAPFANDTLYKIMKTNICFSASQIFRLSFFLFSFFYHVKCDN